MDLCNLTGTSAEGKKKETLIPGTLEGVKRGEGGKGDRDRIAIVTDATQDGSWER